MASATPAGHGQPDKLAAATLEMAVKSVDVFIPCYNYGRYLRQCVDSVLRQTGCQVRVLIIDNASTDNSLEVAHSIARTDGRVDVLAHEKNKGHIATYNDGIAWAGADYMLLLSADDLLAPMALSRAVAFMEQNPNVGFVHGRALRFTDERAISRELHQPPPTDELLQARILPGWEFIQGLCSQPINPVETPTVVVRTALQKRLGGYLPQLPHAGDLEMWLRLAAHADVGEIGALQAFTRLHGKNMRLVYEADSMIQDYRQRHLAFEMFFSSQSAALERAEELASCARRKLAEEILWAAARAFEQGSSRRNVGRLMQEASAIFPSISSNLLWWKVWARRALGYHGWHVLALILQESKRRWPDHPLKRRGRDRIDAC